MPSSYIFSAGVRIKHGLWYNHGDKIWLLTLTNDEANWLLAAIALYITFYSQDFWYLLRWLLHAFRYRDTNPYHVIHHQMQVALRNSGNPASYLYKLCLIWWSWRGVKTAKAWKRCLPDILFSTIVFGAWVMAGIFIANSLEDVPKEVLLSPSRTCGMEYKNWSLTPDEQLPWLRYRQRLMAKTLPIATDCILSSEPGHDCSYLPPLKLNLTGRPAACPLSNPEDCLITREFDFGPLDSNEHFGIDTDHENVVLYNRRVTCAVIDLDKYTINLTAKGNDSVLYPGTSIRSFDVGPLVRHDGEEPVTLPLVNRTALAGYYVSSFQDSDTESNIYWQPKSEIFPTGGNWNLLFLRQPGLRYSMPLEDPFFMSTKPAPPQEESALYYRTDLYEPSDDYKTMACKTTHKFCGEKAGCTDWMKLQHLSDPVNYTSIDWTPMQRLIVERIVNQTSQFSLSAVVQDMGSDAVAASNSLIGNINIGKLDSTQWIYETQRWISMTFAILQYQSAAFVNGFGSQVDDIATMIPGPPELKVLCNRQRVGESGGATRNFFTAGVLAVFLVGIIINGSGLFGGWLNERFQRLRRSDQPRLDWAQDGLFQLHRRHLEREGVVDGWERTEEEVPKVDRHVTRGNSRVEATSSAVDGKATGVVMTVKEMA